MVTLICPAIIEGRFDFLEGLNLVSRDILLERLDDAIVFLRAIREYVHDHICLGLVTASYRSFPLAIALGQKTRRMDPDCP